MNDEDKLQQYADTKRREADQLEGEKANLASRHQSNIDEYERQAQALRDKIDLERDTWSKDKANYNDRIRRLNDEAGQYDNEAERAAEEAERQRQAAATAAVIAATEDKE